MGTPFGIPHHSNTPLLHDSVASERVSDAEVRPAALVAVAEVEPDGTDRRLDPEPDTDRCRRAEAPVLFEVGIETRLVEAEDALSAPRVAHVREQDAHDA